MFWWFYLLKSHKNAYMHPNNGIPRPSIWFDFFSYLFLLIYNVVRCFTKFNKKSMRFLREASTENRTIANFIPFGRDTICRNILWSRERAGDWQTKKGANESQFVKVHHIRCSSLQIRTRNPQTDMLNRLYQPKTNSNVYALSVEKHIARLTCGKARIKIANLFENKRCNLLLWRYFSIWNCFSPVVDELMSLNPT